MMPCLHGHYYPTMPTALVLLQIKKLPPTLIWYQNQNCGFPLITTTRQPKLFTQCCRYTSQPALGIGLDQHFRLQFGFGLFARYLDPFWMLLQTKSGE